MKLFSGKNKITILIIFLTGLIVPVSGQTVMFSKYKPHNDSLIRYFKILASSKNDEEKKSINKLVISSMNAIIQDETSFYFAFDSVKHLGKLISADKALRIINWNIVYETGVHEYFAFIQYIDKNKKYNYYQLNDKAKDLSDPEELTLTPQTWFGALYYQIIEEKSWGTKYYTLLGWDGYNELKNRKIIDVLYFSKDGKPKFGAPIFTNENKQVKRRLIYEYANRVSMTISFNEDADMIQLDHLSPSSENYKGQFQYYGPDGSYDGYKFKKGKWNYKKIIDARNPKVKGQRKKKKASTNF